MDNSNVQTSGSILSCEAHAAGMRIAGGLVVQRLLAN